MDLRRADDEPVAVLERLHDHPACQHLASCRELRGIAFSTQDTPAGVLRRLDATMLALAVEVLGTSVVVQIEQLPDHAVTGRHPLRWSSAGHLPGILVTADGKACWLDEGPSDLMLGVNTEHERHDHEITVDAGSTVLFYNDGLIERRDVALDERLAELATEVSRDPQLDGEALCDRLLHVMGRDAADDVVLLSLQTEQLPGSLIVGA